MYTNISKNKYRNMYPTDTYSSWLDNNSNYTDLEKKQLKINAFFQHLEQNVTNTLTERISE